TPALEGDAIHQVALAEPASRTRRSSRHCLDDRHGRADLFGDGGDDQRHAMGGREFLAAGLRLDGIVEDAEVEVEAGRPVALLDQHLPQRQRVLASRHRHQHGLLGREHPVLADRLADLIAEELDEVRLAEGGVVPPELDDRPSAALPAFQEASPIISPLASPAAGCGCARPSPIISPLASPAAGCGCARPSPIISPLASPRGAPRLALPPLITGRSSIVSSSVTIWSAGTRVSPRITST